ncbi:MAG: zf-TFIIB domain-containing protein [Bdellovibrionales bacterium]|nr:zf-TFIIB domain-containing protein [Bdellovibrionales bacterium]
MNCPNCKEVRLMMSERQGIEIDYCPECRGVWLDRGELDKLIERAIPAKSASMRDSERNSYYRKDDDDDLEHKYEPYHKKKKSFLSDIFD